MSPKTSKTRQNGFSLLETLLATAILSFISILIFNMSSNFFNILSSQGSKQDETRKFIKAYSTLQQTLEFSASNLFYSYANEDTNKDSRWFFYASMTDEEGIPQSSSNTPYWTRIMFWYLRKPADSCSPSPGCCPHKSLVRLCYNYAGPQENRIRCEAFNSFCEHSSCLLIHGNNPSYPENVPCVINNRETSEMFVFSSSSVIAENIADMTIKEEEEGTGIIFQLTSINLDEAKKQIEIGRSDISESKFAEKASWTIYPKN